MDPASLLSAETASLTVDFERDEPESLHELVLPFRLRVGRTGLCHGLAAWFDVAFNGSDATVVLQTGPTAPGTHWYQCRLLLREPIAVNARQTLEGTLTMTANATYSYDLTLRMSLADSGASTADGAPVEAFAHVKLADQYYSYLANPAAGTAAAAAVAAPAPAPAVPT